MILVVVLLVLSLSLILQGVALYSISKKLRNAEKELGDHHISLLRLNHRTTGMTKSVQGTTSGLPGRYI